MMAGTGRLQWEIGESTMLSRMKRRIRNHPLIDTLVTLKGNPRILVFIEPLWGIPYNLVAPFATVYMYSLGVRDVEIGLILSIAMVVQVAFSFLGGIIADKYGRKRTTMLGDFFGWVVPCLIWAVSQNFWFFLIAVLFNSFEQINQTAWYCLLIEDAEKDKTVSIYTWIMIAGLLAVFVAPISGVLVQSFSLVPVVRTIYAGFSILMVIKCVITYRYTTETQQGKIRREETKNTSCLQLIREYRGLIPMIFKDKLTLQILSIMVITYISNMISTNFFGLYVSDTLGLPEQYLAYFPIIKAFVMIIFMFAIQHRMRSVRLPMGVGLGLFVLCQLLLIVSPGGQVTTIILYILLEAVAHALVYPRKESLVANNIDPAERARIIALLTAFMITFSIPFGYLIGLMSSADRRLPFLFSAILFTVAITVIVRIKERVPKQVPGE